MDTFIRNRKKNHLIVLLAAILIAIFVGLSVGQAPSEKECKDKKKPKSPKVPYLSQKKPKPNPVKFSFAQAPRFEAPAPPKSYERVRGISEKTISAHSKVFVYLCVAKGKVKVNGWDRKEVRAFVDGGSKVNFKVRERIGESRKPASIEVYGYNKSRAVARVTGRSGSRAAPRPRVLRESTCLSGRTIELDVPKNASVKIKGSSGGTNVDTVRWAEVKHTGGSIFLNGVRNGVYAQTYRGNVTVKNSGGKVDLGTTNGDIVAYKTEANEIGDYFKARTQGGSVTMQQVAQRDVKVNSLSGSINFLGRLANYGKYSFDTGYGRISLAVNANTSCSVDAKYGGFIKSDLKILDAERKQFGEIKSLSGRIGDGSCNLVFKTFNGSIYIRKLGNRTEIAEFLAPSPQFFTNFRIYP